MRFGIGKPWNNIKDRKDTHSIKWDAMDSILGKGDMMPFWVADMDFESSEAIIMALKERASHGVFGYTADDPEALEAFCGWVQKRHGIAVNPEWIIKSPGVVTAIGLAIAAYTQEGDSIVIQPPVYPQFSEMIQINERRLVDNPIVWVNGRPEMDFEHLESCLKEEGTKMMILCNPHNPLGRVWEESVIRRVCELCQQYNVVLFSDEIHSDLLFSGVKFNSAIQNLKVFDGSVEAFEPVDSGDNQPREPFENRPQKAHGLVVAMAPSKTFNIAGLFYSLVIVPDEAMHLRLKKVIDKLHLFPVNCFNEEAAKAAYSGSQAWLDSLLPYLEDNYKALCEFFQEKMPQVQVCPMEGTYLAWLDFRALIPDGLALKKFMMNEANIAVNDGRAFGPGGEGFVRFNFGCPKSVMLEGLELIYEAYLKHEKSDPKHEEVDQSGDSES